MISQLFIVFFKIGLFTFGGGYAMIPLIKEEVISHNWATLSEIIDFIGISESTPGPFAVNIATFIGFDHNGLIGAAAATLGVCLLYTSYSHSTFCKNWVFKYTHRSVPNNSFCRFNFICK